MRRAGSAELFLATGLALSACGGGGLTSYRSSQATWSEMTDEQRAAVRAVISKFTGSGIQPISVLSTTGVIVGEGERVLADPAATSLVVDAPLDLTAAEVLPELDATGTWDPTGGYVQFNEVVHDDVNDVVSDEDVRHAAREFTSGSLGRFAVSNTVETPKDMYFISTNILEFEVDGAIAYEETAWDQQREFDQFGDPVLGNQKDETFAYQSFKTFSGTIDSPGSMSFATVSEDQILTHSGFDEISATTTTIELAGTHTLYQPVLVAANTRDEEPFTADSTGTTIVTDTSTVTTVTDPPIVNLVGTDSELEETTIVTASVDTEVVTDTDIANPCETSNETITHTTTAVTYEIADGMADEAALNRSLEKYEDYVVTVLDTLLVERSCQADGSFTETTTHTILKFTDNPKTRNDITSSLCKSTRTQVVVTFDNSDALNPTTTVHDAGTEWLTDQLEVDPDVNALAWAVKGTSTSQTEEHQRYYGDNLEAEEWTEIVTLDQDITYTVAGVEVRVDGTKTTRSARITAGPANDLITHEFTGDGDGTYSLTMDGTSYSISVEEYDAAVQ